MIADTPTPTEVPVVWKVERKKALKVFLYLVGVLGSIISVVWAASAISTEKEFRLSAVEDHSKLALEVPVLKKEMEMIRVTLDEVKGTTAKTHDLLIQMMLSHHPTLHPRRTP